MLGFVLLAIVVGIQLIIVLPRYFIRKNNRIASQEAFEEYLKEMVRYDKQYASRIKITSKNLNLVNFWLKTANGPNEGDTEEERKKNLERFNKLDLSSEEASEWTESLEKSKLTGMDINKDAKKMRNSEFTVYDLETNEFGQDEMTFYYSTEFADCIYYCVTPEALDKKFYKNIIYFTTCRPTQIPLVYPHKYDGAQMLSLYKHPCQAVWFLKNWKKIREGLEIHEEMYDLDIEDSLNDFDL